MSPRLRVNEVVRIDRPDRSVVGLMTSINRNGLFIRTPHSAHLGERLAIHFELTPTGGPVEVEGEVVTTNGPHGYDGRMPMGLGVRFVDVDRATRARIDAFLHRAGER